MNLPQIGTPISLIPHVLLELSHMPHPEVQSMSPPLDRSSFDALGALHTDFL